DGAPLVTGGNVYVVVRRQRSFGFEDALLCRFEAETGRLTSQAHLCGASTGEYGRQRNTTSIPSLVDGVLYVESSLGVVAAVCPHRGKVCWVHAYDTLSRRDWGRGQGARAEVLGGWQFSPVFGVADRLIALPLDCESLLVLDRSGGGLVQSVPRSELAGATAVVGVRGSRLYGIGTAKAFCYDLGEAALLWTAPWPAEAEVTGYAALTKTELLIPTSAGLCRVDLATGQLETTAWDEGLGGNLLPMPDQLVVAAFDGIRVYARRADVWARHEAEFHARPEDPGAALDLADVAFRLGRDAEGAAAVEEAVRRAGGFAGPMDVSVKRRLFEDSLRFVARLQDREGADPAVLSRLFAVAAQTPPDTDAHVRLRFVRAAWDESAGRIREAVALYQQVIADRSLREHVSAAEAGAAEPAGELARRHVARLIEWHGPDVYAECEQKAQDLLAAARRTGDISLLDRVTETYPNAQSAGTALVEKGRLLTSRGDAAGAAEAFRAALARYATTVDMPAVIRALVDAYVQDGRQESAFRWTVRGARQYPSYRFEVDGERLDFAACRDRLREQWGPLEPPRPALGPPLIALAPRTFSSEVTLLAPRFADARRTSWRQYYVFVESGIQAFGAGNQPVWSNPAPCRMAPELLLATDDVAVVGTRHQVLAVDAAAGTVRWAFGVYPADLLDPNTDHEQFTEFRAFGYGNDRLVCVQEDGQTVCLDVHDGRVVWRRQIEDEAVGDVSVSETWVIVRVANLGRPVLEVLDARTGERVRQLRPPVNEAVVASALSLDGKAIAVTPRNLCAFDVASGQLLWQRKLDRVVLPATVCADVDGLCFATASGLLEKVNLDTGRPIWSAPSPVRGAFDAPRAHLVDGRLLLTSERQVCEVDSLDGRLLWEMSGVDRPNFQDRFVAERHVVAVHWPGRAGHEGFRAYFFDLTEGGRPAAAGGVLELGEFERVRRTVLCDVGLVLQEDNTIHVWSP
ncbi:MAG: PQQ-like beta-propeller repeat protein, partial [Phycisphaerae bacterium]|nr:PQQ-like beta-propeller repeat protein [Phycisphaerae bacterium]